MSATIASRLQLRSTLRLGERGRITVWQILVLVLVLLPWEVLTRIPWFQEHTVLDPFFVSRPRLASSGRTSPPRFGRPCWAS